MGLKYVLFTFGAIEDEIYDFDMRHKSWKNSNLKAFFYYDKSRNGKR